MLPNGYILKLIKKYNIRLLYWAIVMVVLSVFPVIHQANKPAIIANWDYLAISAFMMIALTNLVKYLIWNSKPVLHPVFKYLRRLGDPEEMVSAIDADALKAGGGTESSILAAGSWIVYQGFFKFKLIPLSDVIWFYPKISDKKLHDPNGSALIVFTKDEKAHLLKYRHIDQGENPVAAVSRRAPWSFTGYSAKMVSRWKTNRKEMIDTVQKKIEKIFPLD